MFDLTNLGDIALRMIVAGVLGGLVGIERRLHGRWADIRTHMAVAMGAAVFVLLGMIVAEESPSETTRVIQGIATGVGFLGAGTILKLSDQLEVKGLTTASAIWLSAAVGTAAGMAHYDVAVVATLISLVVLALLRPLEKRLSPRDE